MNVKKTILLMFALAVITTSAFSVTSTNFTVYWSVASSYDHTVSFNANCSGGTAYFVEADNSIADAIIDGNGWMNEPYDDAVKSNLCQSNSASYFAVTITGSATSDLDLNVTADTGEDVNFKVFLADTGDDFCGCEDGLCDGWEEDCTQTAGTVTATTCALIGTSDGQFYAGLASGATAEFCATADFNTSFDGTKVTLGDNEETVGLTSGAP